MINNIIQKTLEDARTNRSLSKSEMTDLENLLINKIFKFPYFKDVKLPFVFLDNNNHIQSSKPDVSSWSLITDDEKSQLMLIFEKLNNAVSLDDKNCSFSEDDFMLVKNILGTGHQSDAVVNHMSMFKLYEDYSSYDNNNDYHITHRDLGSLYLLSNVEKACRLTTDFSFNSTSTDIIRKHFFSSDIKLNQDTVPFNTIKAIVSKENETLKKLFDKKVNIVFSDPRLPPDDFSHTKTYDDLTPILTNPIIRNSTNIGILFDDSITNISKLFKLYMKNYFNGSKSEALYTLDYQIGLPSVEDLSVKYNHIINSTIENMSNELPILNTERSNNLYFKQNDVNFNDCATKDKFHKFNFLVDDLIKFQDGLINLSSIPAIRTTLNVVNINLMDKHADKQLALTGCEIVGYDNGIESLLTLTSRYIAEHDVPAKNKPKICIVNQLIINNQPVDKTLEIFNHFVDEQTKKGITVILNTHNTHSSYIQQVDNFFSALKPRANLIIVDSPSFESKVNIILDCIDRAEDKIKNDSQSFYLFQKTFENVLNDKDIPSSLHYEDTPYVPLSKKIHNSFDELLNNLDKVVINHGLKI